MNTYLGACADLGPADIDPEVIAAAQITYLEAISSTRRWRKRPSARLRRSPMPPGTRWR